VVVVVEEEVEENCWRRCVAVQGVNVQRLSELVFCPLN